MTEISSTGMNSVAGKTQEHPEYDFGSQNRDLFTNLDDKFYIVV